MPDGSSSNPAGEIVRKVDAWARRLFGPAANEIALFLKTEIGLLRFTRAIALQDKVDALIEQRGLQGKTIPLPPKIGIPILQRATLEEDDTLQEIWARLIASNIDPRSEAPVRAVFVEIVASLEVIDAHVLLRLYLEYLSRAAEYPDDDEGAPTQYGVPGSVIMEKVEIQPQAYRTSVDNLFRNALARPFEEPSSAAIWSADRVPRTDSNPTVTFGYSIISITALGVDFVRACLLETGSEARENR